MVPFPKKDRKDHEDHEALVPNWYALPGYHQRIAKIDPAYVFFVLTFLPCLVSYFVQKYISDFLTLVICIGLSFWAISIFFSYFFLGHNYPLMVTKTFLNKYIGSIPKFLAIGFVLCMAANF